MKFEIHKKFRFKCDWSEEEYHNAEKDYFSHLKKINFKRKSSLVKYFGNSFFHDADVQNISICLNTGKVVLHLFTLNDLVDLNSYREAKGFEHISWRKYEKKPIVYKCEFSRVSKVLFSDPVDFAEDQIIMDTELDHYRKTNEFVVRISFSEQDEIEIVFKGSGTVKIENKDLISNYLEGHRKSIPRCEVCKSRLLDLISLK